MEPTLEDIRAAAERIGPRIHRTPVMTSRSIDALCGARVFFKCENLQKAGAFKIRGATNAVFSLPPECKAVATHSSGNHAAALSLAASWRGIKAHVVMPSNSPAVKQEAVRGYGGEIVFCEPTLAAREETLARVVRETGAEFIPPYNDYRVIAGQGTAALELLEDEPDLDAVLAPVGGGGLLAGTAIAVRGLGSRAEVIGTEPAGADDAHRSLHAGRIIPMEKPQTIADGLRTSLGDRTFPIILRLVPKIVTVSEEAIVAAMRVLWERMKIIVEPSSAVPLAALMTRREEIRGEHVGIILSGGNVDLNQLPWSIPNGRSS
ncbi:MAG: pyridoxal-phosphate dependent enzyme [Verrucomicrobiota bacterium]